jgi:hypothetical protein
MVPLIISNYDSIVIYAETHNYSQILIVELQLYQMEKPKEFYPLGFYHFVTKKY